MKKTINIAALVITGFWLVVFLISIFGYFFFKAPANTEPLDAFMTKGIYIVFALYAVMGALSAVLFKLSFKSAIGDGSSPKTTLKKVALGISVFVNILFYAIFASVFLQLGDYMFIVMLLWLLCAIANAVLLLLTRKKCVGAKHA